MNLKPETTGFVRGGMLFLEPPAKWRSWQRDIWSCCCRSPEALLRERLTPITPAVGFVICNPAGEPGPIWRRAMEIDPEAFAAASTIRHVGTSARRIIAIDRARAEAETPARNADTETR